MSALNDNPSTSLCDECGYGHRKITRVYKGLRFCNTCYCRLFKTRNCLICNQPARLLTRDPAAICRSCESKRPCVRCGRSGRKIGKITTYGVVCNSCSPYFRAQKPCSICGEFSPRLSIVKRLNINTPICPKCARSDHGTCQACKRYRLLQSGTGNRSLCNRCIDNGNIACEQCGQLMPAGRGKTCESCYWQHLLDKRIKMDCIVFNSPNMARHFEVFGRWLGTTRGSQKAALKIHNYLEFFIEIEDAWMKIPDYSRLLKHFGVSRLRKYLLPMKWLEESALIHIDIQAKIENTENRRIQSLLRSLPKNKNLNEILIAYHQQLLLKQERGKTTTRSIRLAIQPAFALLQKCLSCRLDQPNQKLLASYLSEKPGQRAAISGFVRYLNTTYCLNLELPEKSLSGKRRRHRKRENELIELLLQERHRETFHTQVLRAALAYFHDIPKSRLNSITMESSDPCEGGGLYIHWNNNRYWIPDLDNLMTR